MTKITPKRIIFLIILVMFSGFFFYLGYLSYSLIEESFLYKYHQFLTKKLKELTDSGVIRLFFIALGAAGLIGLLFEGFCFLRFASSKIFEVFHAPKTVSCRANHFTANICGRIGARARRLEYKLNKGAWNPVRQLEPYNPLPSFDIELPVDVLKPGKNKIEFHASAKIGRPKTGSYIFEYNPDPPSFPQTIDWKDEELEVAHGYWDTIEVDEEWRARPKPGYEGYDRILIITGAFEGARRIETDMIFRRDACPAGLYTFGFGILPLWGGRPDRENVIPKRGWEFSLAWYYSKRKAVGQEFSYKFGDNKQNWIGQYRNHVLEPNLRNHLVVETWPYTDQNKGEMRYRQRMKWWQEKEHCPQNWMVLDDLLPQPLKESTYGVAFVCYYCQVELGPVKITTLDRI
jgi:hypothetical protein